MKKPRIVFMGTPEFAVASLKALVDNNYNVVAVITAPDKPAGRGRKLRTSAVKDYAVNNGLLVLQPSNLKDPSFLKELKSLQADLQVVVAFRMLPEQVWRMASSGTFNLHASLLPEYRGAAPINWAIINGEIKTGLTTFYINEQIDTGAILLQREVAIGPDDTAGKLHDTLMEAGSDLVLETVKSICQGDANPRDQPNLKLKPAPKLNKDNCRIDWSMPLDKIYNHIRGLNPYPSAWTILQHDQDQIECKVHSAIIAKESHSLRPGTIRSSKKEILVAVADGFIKIENLQLSGKRKMDVVSFLNGFRFEPNDKFI